MKKLPILKPGDKVEIIAPASRLSDLQLKCLINCLESWHLDFQIADPLFGKDLFCANTDEMRFHHLYKALFNPETKAVISARGGYGSMRLIPYLKNLTPPPVPKIFIGMSDITALHLFFQQKWLWPTVHGAIAPDRISEESLRAMQTLLFNYEPIIFDDLVPLNKHAEKAQQIKAPIIGGNLSLIQASMGTHWQLNAKHKILLLEEVGERGYRIDRMLEQLKQAEIFNQAEAILLGDFSKGLEPNGSSLIEPALLRFAESASIPVLQIAGIGHNFINFPIPLGTETELQLGARIQLHCARC